MILRKHIFLFFLSLLMGLESYSQTANWVLSPTYDNINYYSSGVFKYYKNGKVGLIDVLGRNILKMEVDSITNPTEGYSLALVKESGGWVVSGIIGNEGSSYTPVGNKLYLTRYPFFSEGKLCVMDKNKKKGYIDTSGEVVVKCQFIEARPFREGWASVEVKQNEVIYINEKYDTNGKRPLTVDFHDGNVTFGTTFRNGKALIACYSDFAFIDRSGKIIEKYRYKSGDKLPISSMDYSFVGKNERPDISADNSSQMVKDANVNCFQEEGLWGYSSGGQLILPAQFDEAQPFVNGYAKVKSGGRVGLLRLVDGSINVSIDKSRIEVLRGEDIPECRLTLSVPSGFDDSSIRVILDKGDGILSNMGSERAFTPVFTNGVDKCAIRYSVYSDNLKLIQEEKTIDIIYPTRLMITSLKTTQDRADENDRQEVYAEIFNDSAIPVTVSVVLTIPAKLNNHKDERGDITIPAGEIGRISTTLTVKNSEAVPSIVSVNIDGKTYAEDNKTINLRTFY